MKPVTLAGLVGLALVACSAPAGAPGDASGSGDAARAGSAATSVASPATASSTPVRLAVVGDSLSAGFSSPFTQEGLHPSSYVYWATRDGVALAGGTAVPGATSREQRDRATPVDADVLVMALGTNDLAVGLPFSTTEAALKEIVTIVGVDRVLLLAVPPADPEFRPTTVAFNAELRGLAESEGWTFVDAVAVVRDGGGWDEGMTTDGVHYTEEGARLVGEAVAEAVLAAAPDPR